MESSNCISCLKPKSHLKCGLCKNIICKKCAQFVPENSFSFLKEIPELLTHGIYCLSCFDEKINPELQSYQETMIQARNVSIFYKKQSKETRLFKRTEPPIQVLDCVDPEETIFRLAFLAVKSNFNTLIDVDISSQKVRIGGYQTSIWKGVGVPIQVDPEKLDRWNPPRKRK